MMADDSTLGEHDMSEHEHRTHSLEQIDVLAQRLYERLLSAPSESSCTETIQCFMDDARQIATRENVSADDIYHALAQLSRAQIELLHLSGVQGLDYTEIARRLQRPPDDVLRALSRARALCRFHVFRFSGFVPRIVIRRRAMSVLYR